MSERPFMQLYTSDFLGDTQFLSAEYVGSYLLLLMTMWNADGAIPNDEVTLARVARLTVEEWRLAWKSLGRFFVVEGDQLTHKRLAFELHKFARKSAARKEAGRKGGSAKSLKSKNSGLAIAKAIGLASSRNQNKEGATRSDPTESVVRVDRRIEPELFAACVSLTEPVKPFIEAKSFPLSIVVRAKSTLQSGESVH